jgi:hypothetical protein
MTSTKTEQLNDLREAAEALQCRQFVEVPTIDPAVVQVVPCGHCPPCRVRAAAELALRPPARSGITR